MANTIKHRRASIAAWTASNPVLAAGEIGVELSVGGTPQAIKIGDGVTSWNSLSYISKAGGQRIAYPDDEYVIDPVLDKLILADCNNNNVTITMPVIAQSMGREFIIRHTKGANVVKIVGQSGNTVDGLNIITLTAAKDFVRLINDGNSDWCLVGGAYS